MRITIDEAITRYKNNAKYERIHDNLQGCLEFRQLVEWLEELKQLRELTKWIPVVEKYEYHIDHTDCIWYGSDSGCPVTCSQYRDGWNDAMDYIFKNGKGYQPYIHNG